MMITEYVDMRIVPKNYNYWKDKGYPVKSVGGYGGKSTGNQIIRVKTIDLPPNSNADVDCRCQTCGEIYTQRFSRNKEICVVCRTTDFMSGNKYGSANRGRKVPSMMGELHPRWNKDKNLYRRYQYRVQRLTEETYAKHRDQINPDKHPRTLCGVEGGYQLDHIISIKNGFEQGMTPVQLADLSNLQMLPWSTNRAKWHN